MGWTYSSSWQTKKQVIDAVTSQSHWGENFHILKKSIRGNHLWVLVQYADTPETQKKQKAGLKFVCLFLLSKDAGEYGYKDIDETMGPCELDCPKSYIEEAEQTGSGINEYARNWREKVIAYHAKKNTNSKRAFKAGDIVQYYDRQYILCEKAGPRLGWLVKDRESGNRYRMKQTQLNAGKVIAETTPSTREPQQTKMAI